MTPDDLEYLRKYLGLVERVAYSDYADSGTQTTAIGMSIQQSFRDERLRIVRLIRELVDERAK